MFAVIQRSTSGKAVGLTTALVELPGGFVVVGSLPAPGGASANMTAGALTVLNSSGKVVRTISGGQINGPWDITVVTHGKTAPLFVANVLNGELFPEAAAPLPKPTRSRLEFRHGGQRALAGGDREPRGLPLGVARRRIQDVLSSLAEDRRLPVVG